MVHVFGGESISTPFVWGRTRGCGRQFQDFLAVHKLSTVRRKLSPSKTGFSTGSPQMEAGRRWLHACPGRAARKRAARKRQARPGGRRSAGLARRPAGPHARARPSRKGSVLARRSAGPDARAWPSPRGSARQTGDTPNCRHEFGQARRGQRVRQEIGRGAHAGRAACHRTERSRTTGAAPRAGPQGRRRPRDCAGQRKRPLHA